MLPGSYEAGFTSTAFQGLLNLINADPSIYFYYGSETTPPCNENIFWQVFQRERSLSKEQFQFLYHQLVKKMDGTKVDETVKSKKDVYGNKRAARHYDPNVRGFILHNPIGSLGTNKKSS